VSQSKREREEQREGGRKGKRKRERERERHKRRYQGSSSNSCFPSPQSALCSSPDDVGAAARDPF
jgi:hypothetical protein